MMTESYESFVRRATSTESNRDGRMPYPYQMGVAELGLPELLAVPTGCGKTQAVVLGHLYRRFAHPDEDARRRTPRRLVFVLPMRVLAEQTANVVREWLERLGLADKVQCHLLLGGERLNSPWRRSPEGDMIIVGTLDMILSRALNRGYGESRYCWPIDMGLFGADCHFVYDEVQLMGPGLATSRQLHGLRRVLGTAIPCSSTWMSATVPEKQLRTFDAPTVDTRIELGDDDLAHAGLALRLDARKTVEQIDAPDPKRYAATLAAQLAERHRAGTLTLAVLNTVNTARELYVATRERAPGVPVVLLHSRFRPGDRQRAVERALSTVDADGPGIIVISTQVVEAGVDISAALLLTEVAPWPSIVQRAGRCNRDGQQTDATLLWVQPLRPEPYNADDIAASAAALGSLEGVTVTPGSLRAMDVATTEEIVPVLRRRDLLDLFDTMPDLTGNDLDVSRFIRSTDDLDLTVAWRDLTESGPSPEERLPTRDERCPVPVNEIRRLVKDRGLRAWQYDHIDDRWTTVGVRDVRPGMVLVLDSRSGCYDSERGWNADARDPVVPLAGVAPEADDVSLDDDPVSVVANGWVSLHQHLADTKGEAVGLLDALTPNGLSVAMRSAVIDAARLHDVGKVHPHFQGALRACARDGDPPAPADDVVLAKSAGRGRLRHSPDRPHFRHELVSALMLLGEGQVALRGSEEPDLALYLVAAHHGRIRMAVRSMPDEAALAPRRVLGVTDGDAVDAVMLDDVDVPATALDVRTIDGSAGGRTWSARMLDLRDREDIGVFRLAFMEAMVRLADWRASASSPALVPGSASDA